MSNISRRRIGELERGVFKILLDHSEGLPAKGASCYRDYAGEST